MNEFYHRRGTGKFVFDGTAGPWASDSTLDTNTKALADFLAGEVSSCTVPVGTPPKSECGSTIAVGNPERFVRVNAFNSYFQDSWQLTHRLNLNFGMRYEVETPYSERYDHVFYGFDYNGASPVQVPGLSLRGGPLYAAIDGSPRAEGITDKSNFGPRAGFAWQVRPGTVLRGGYGIFYPTSAAQGIRDALASSPFNHPLTKSGAVIPLGGVRAADRSTEDLEDDLARVGCVRIRNVLDPDVPRPVEDSRSHAFSTRSGL